MVCTSLPFFVFLPHHSQLAFHLTVVSARRGSLRNDDDGINVVLREVAVDTLPGHECKHSSGLAPLANTASITRWLASASTSPMRMWCPHTTLWFARVPTESSAGEYLDWLPSGDRATSPTRRRWSAADVPHKETSAPEGNHLPRPPCFIQPGSASNSLCPGMAGPMIRP